MKTEFKHKFNLGDYVFTKNKEKILKVVEIHYSIQIGSDLEVIKYTLEDSYTIVKSTHSIVDESDLTPYTGRNPVRIKEVLAKVEKYWAANPDWRLGQLIFNATSKVCTNPSVRDLFNLEDVDLLYGVQELINNG
jgi:hypothetical protein